MILISVALLTAGGVGSYAALTWRSSSGPAVVADGPTFYQALAALNESVDAEPGGPWTITQVYGVASPVPADPGSWGYDLYDQAWSSCQGLFNGVTLWNGTIPIFKGTYNSGTAPFWQIVYFSNASQQILVTTDVLGVVALYPPIAMSSLCAERTGFTAYSWKEAQIISEYGFPGDTPAMARTIWDGFGKQYSNWLRKPLAEMYLFGGVEFGSGQAASTEIQFFTCGTPGEAGATPGLAAYAPYSDTAELGTTWNYTLGCTPESTLGVPIPLRINFTSSSILQASNATIVDEKYQFLMEGSPPFVGTGDNLRGMTSWMVGLNLTGSDGTPLPLASPGCAAWVPSVTDCVRNMSGWYAVLLSPDDEWEGTYGLTATGPGWSYPVLPIANNETIALIVPTSWNVSGDLLQIASTTPELPLTGSVELE